MLELLPVQLQANAHDKATGKPLGGGVPTCVIENSGRRIGLIGQLVYKYVFFKKNTTPPVCPLEKILIMGCRLHWPFVTGYNGYSDSSL